MYTLILDRGTVVRDSDTKTIAPCESELDLDFVAYIDWITAGNQPVVLETLLEA